MQDTLKMLTVPGWRVEWHGCVDSTNTVARAHIAPAGARLAIVADLQTAGRGQYGRTWLSPAGANLLCSFRLAKQDVPAPALAALGAGAAVCTTLAAFDVRGCCRWPNDVMVSGAKIAGILVEQTQDALIIGIGMNVGWPASRSSPDGNVPWTSLRAETGIVLDRGRILTKLAAQVGAGATASAAVVLDAYRRCWCGPSVLQVRRGRVARTATACDITTAGALRIRYNNGRRRDVVSSADIRYN